MEPRKHPEQHQLRMPLGMKRRLAERAMHHHRTVSGEIVHILSEAIAFQAEPTAVTGATTAEFTSTAGGQRQ